MTTGDDDSDRTEAGRPVLIENYRYLFLLTYGRTGSTVLNRVLNSIPGYLIRGENQNALFQLFRYLRAVRAARFDYVRAEVGPEHPWYGASGIRHRRIETETLKGFVRNVLRPQADSRVIGFKEIRHTRFEMTDAEFRAYADFLVETFPGARLVFNKRAWEDVARSGWWSRMPGQKVEDLVGNADQRFRAVSEAHPDQCFEIDYESYAENVQGLAPLFSFLGEPFEAERVAQVMAQRLTHAQELSAAPAAPATPATATQR